MCFLHAKSPYDILPKLQVILALLGRNMSWDIVNPEAEWKRSQGSLFMSPEDGMLVKFTSLNQ